MRKSNPVFKLNTKYDKIQEPFRFLLCMAVITPVWFGLGSHVLPLVVLSATFLIALLSLRIAYLYR